MALTVSKIPHPIFLVSHKRCPGGSKSSLQKNLFMRRSYTRKKSILSQALALFNHFCRLAWLVLQNVTKVLANPLTAWASLLYTETGTKRQGEKALLRVTR